MRLLTYLSLMTTLLLVCIAPHTATAAVTCQAAYSSPSTWPYNGFSFYCPGSTNPTVTQADGQNMAYGGNQVGGNAYHQLNQLQPKLYLFENPADYATYFPSANGNPVPNSTDFGVIKFDSHNIPTWVAVFKVNKNGEQAPNVTYATGEQLSHAIDSSLAFVMNGGIVSLPNATISGSAAYNAQLTQDWTAITAKAPCGSSGFFFGQQDSKGEYFCTTNGTGSTLSTSPTNYTKVTGGNKGILQAAERVNSFDTLFLKV